MLAPPVAAPPLPSRSRALLEGSDEGRMQSLQLGILLRAEGGAAEVEALTHSPQLVAEGARSLGLAGAQQQLVLVRVMLLLL